MSGQHIPRWLGIVLLLVIATVFGSNHVAARLAFEHGANVTTAVAFRSTGTALFVLVPRPDMVNNAAVLNFGPIAVFAIAWRTIGE